MDLGELYVRRELVEIVFLDWQFSFPLMKCSFWLSLDLFSLLVLLMLILIVGLNLISQLVLWIHIYHRKV